MKKFLAVMAIMAITLFGLSAFAYDVKVDDDTYAKVGIKGQIWYQYLENGAPNGSAANDFAIKQIRLYGAGQITNLFKFGANVDFAKGTTDKPLGTTPDAGSATVADGYVMLDFMKEAKLMVGIYRMAVSRIALQDSYTYMMVHAPSVGAARYLSNQNNYRNAGVTLWGDVANGMFRYNVGLWDGSYSPVVTGATGTPVPTGNPSNLTQANNPDRMAYSARVAVNLWDPEPGYTNSCCYLGKAKILALGLGYLDQPYSGSAGSGHYTVKTADAFLAMDPITVEAAYFLYDYDDPLAGTGGQKPTGWYAQASFKVLDKLEPAFRYESWDADNSSVLNDYKRYVAGINYYLDGHNAKITLERCAEISKGNVQTISRTTPDYSRNFADWTLQLEFQF